MQRLVLEAGGSFTGAARLLQRMLTGRSAAILAISIFDGAGLGFFVLPNGMNKGRQVRLEPHLSSASALAAAAHGGELRRARRIGHRLDCDDRYGHGLRRYLLELTAWSSRVGQDRTDGG